MQFAAKEFLLELLSCGLVRQEQWDHLSASHKHRLFGCSEVNRLLDQLLTLGLLTGYQAGRIRARKPQWLILGEYRILDRLGAGNMGVVFKAEHLMTRDPVAIKVLVPTGNQASTAFFTLLAERRSLALVHHPNIVRTLDIGEARCEDPDCPLVYYCVMDYVTGVDAEERVRRDGPLPIDEACEVAYQVAGALTAAHQHNLVHRDLKPSNILLTDSGQAKLLDFGLVRTFNAALGNSRLHPSRPEFMAPEQGDPSGVIDIRTDLYSLGATLFWLLTGKAPFEVKGDWQAGLAERAQQPAPAIAEAYPELPADLAVLLEQMLSPNPEGRPQNPVAVLAALQPFRPEARKAEPVPVATPAQAQRHLATGAVLVIDADDDSRRLCLETLAAHDIEADEASTGKQGLEMAVTGQHHLVVLADRLPEVDGLELVKYLRDCPPRPHLKVLVLCGLPTPESIGQVLSAGADDYLAKPVDPEQFATRVQTMLILRQQQEEASQREQEQAQAPVEEAEPIRPPQPRRHRSGLLKPLGWLFGA